MDTRTLPSINPANGKLIKSYNTINDEQIDRALSSASRAFGLWRQVSLKDRAKVLRSIAAELRIQKETLAMLATSEMGKPIQQSRDEIEKCARTFEFYAVEGTTYLADEAVITDARKSYVAYKPLGVVLAVMPWNFPFWQVFRAMAPILMAGNAMVLKHASNIPGCALAIEMVLKKAQVPKGLFHTLLVTSAKVEQLISDRRVAAVTFTGSTAAGRKVAASAGQHLKKQVLELGGSDPYVILADADLKKAVEVCYNARLVNSGQSCVAAKRFIAVKAVRKEFERMMVEKMSQASFGDPMDTANKIGPMARVDLRDELHQQVMKSVEMGAKILCGGFIPEMDGAFYPPTVLGNVKKGMPAYDEELFGPVAAIIEAKDDTHALGIANDSEYGLGGAIFSKNRKYAEMLAASELDAGNCFVNASVHSDPRLPFGGTKNSGYGRELGEFGIREFVNIKTVFVQ